MLPSAAGPKVLGLNRFPVKSMLGEQLAQVDIDVRGIAGDRLWSVRTAAGKIGSGKNSRRFAAVDGLLDLRAGWADGRVVVQLPDGRSCPVDDPDAAELISGYLGRPVTFARESGVSHFDDGAVSLLGSASVSAVAADLGEPVEAARFRANIVLDTTEPFIEDTWVGREVRVGTAVLEVQLALPRCVMVNAKTADLPAAPGNLKAVGRVNAACLGVVGRVVRPGSVALGDRVEDLAGLVS